MPRDRIPDPWEKDIEKFQQAHTSKTGNGRVPDNPIPDTFRAEKGVQKGKATVDARGQERWLALPISQLVADTDNADWYWHGYLGAQLVTLFTGLWKAGKSTMLSVLLKSLDGQQDYFCGQAVKGVKVLVITEETSRKWIERRDLLGLEDYIHIIPKPFLMPPNKADWIIFLAHIAEQVKKEKYGLVIFDSIFNLWAVQDENNASEVRDALMPLNMCIEEGAGIMLVAHPKKGDASEGQATRGTGALPAYVDVILEMRRFDAEHHADTKRVLTTYSRFEETPAELVIEYSKTDHTYTAIGSRSEVKAGQRMNMILNILPAGTTAYTVEEILQNWPVADGFLRPSAKTIKRDVDQAVFDNLLHRRGNGVKNDPHRFYRT